MPNTELLMNSLAETLSEHLGYNSFELTNVEEGNLNYSFKMKGETFDYFIKYFSNRLIKREGIRGIDKRYKMEKFVLSTCNQAGLLTPKLEASIDNNKILILENLIGESLTNCFFEIEDSLSVLYVIGLWIGEFHNIFEIKEFCNSLSAEFAFIYKIKSSGDNDQFLDEIVKKISKEIALLKFQKRVLSRNDCHFGNFIYSNNMIYGIDFELCSYQYPPIDLAGIFVSYIDLVANNNKNIDCNNIFSDYQYLLKGYNEATGEDLTNVFVLFIEIILLKKYYKTKKNKYLNYLIKVDNISIT